VSTSILGRTRNDDLLGTAWRLRRGRFSLTIHSPGVRSRGHVGILFCGKKNNDQTAG
jgi:hypothetical protein